MHRDVLGCMLPLASTSDYPSPVHNRGRSPFRKQKQIRRRYAENVLRLSLVAGQFDGNWC